MDTPMPYDSGCLNNILDQFKPSVRALPAYHAPSQRNVSVKLNQNESPFDVPAFLKGKILYDMKKLNWNRYPEYTPEKLRERLAQWFGIEPQQILLGNGSNSLIYAAFSAIIEPRDTIVLSPPSFSLYELIGTISEANIIYVNQKPDLTYDEDGLTAAISKSKLSVFSSPGNPTGRMLPLKTLEAMLKATKGLILWDEAYAEFCGQTALPLLTDHPNLVILRTFSKAFSMAGLRLGCLLAHPQIIAQIQKVKVPYNVNLFSMTAALHVLNNTEWLKSNIQNILNERKCVFNSLKELDGIKPFPTDTNFITFRTSNGKSIFQKLMDKGILVRDMGGYAELKNCLRVTIGTPEENQIFLTALKEIITS